MRDHSARSSAASSRPRCRRGLGMIELLISLAIVAALLTSVTIAINAAFTAYAINQQQASLMQQARVAMHRVTTSIRITDAHAPESTALAQQFAAGQTVTCTAIAMIDAAGTDIVYSHDAANHRLLAIVEGTRHVLATGVDAFTVKMEPMRSPTALRTGGSHDLLRRATITLAIRTDPDSAPTGERSSAQTLILSTAVAPRQNTW